MNFYVYIHLFLQRASSVQSNKILYIKKNAGHFHHLAVFVLTIKLCQAQGHNYIHEQNKNQ